MEEIKGFYIHLIVYISVNIAMFLVNILSSPEELWFYWPLLGWGVGIVAHGISVFGIRGAFGPEWEERKIREIMQKDREKDEGPQRRVTISTPFYRGVAEVTQAQYTATTLCLLLPLL